MHENSQTESVGNEVQQRASKDLANNLNLALLTIYTFLLFFCCFGCYKGEKPGDKGFSPATGSATGQQPRVQRAVPFRMEAPSVL
ncbi:tweety protein [[Ruminococcus] lactaris]|uniref:Tweety protein n=1 Tax=[Ruminococcus] lactaris TaxID=46228 RepID=A0A414P7T4_9FIRM|nr:tweety protein [[Ruminococcus] lactaris]